MLRVPGSQTDLLSVKAQGGDVRMVYSPLDAVKLAQKYPDRQVVFFAVGFETTAPGNAMAVWQARQFGLTNFRARQRDGRLAGAAVRPDQLLDPLFACAGAAGDGSDLERGRQSSAGLLGRGARVHSDGLLGVRADRRKVPRADRHHRLRAARSAPGHLHDDQGAGRGTLGRGKPICTRGHPRGQSG